MLDKIELMKRHNLYVVIDYIPIEGKHNDLLQHAAILWKNNFVAYTATDIIQIRIELAKLDRADENNRFFKPKYVATDGDPERETRMLELKIPNTKETILIGRSDALTIHDKLQAVVFSHMNITHFVRTSQERKPKVWARLLQEAGMLN
ncbi:hypothetical protein [Sulfuricurvum sp.]|uniref:hypothetical protein n=1 Tax=Sulfuricurvum sp. TaxID=2025608 RepID=UPI00260A8E10|nr:hypothetical protein [Sulfuricurvum sp.]MDD3597780.1 hypothetical protein [Sulfuricurvum sp.]